MKMKKQIAGWLSSALCLSLVACGGSQDRTKITDRGAGRNKVQNSKLLKKENIVQKCAGDSGEKTDTKEILSLSGLKESLSTDTADTFFASTFTSNIQFTDMKGKIYENNKDLLQSFVYVEGLQYNFGTLKDISPTFIDLATDSCRIVSMPLPAVGETPSLFFQLARIDAEELSQFAMAVEADDNNNNNNDNPDVKKDETEKTETTKELGFTFSVDLKNSTDTMLILNHPNGKDKIVVKLIDDETLVVTRDSIGVTNACGMSYPVKLRNEATLVWGKKWQEPAVISNDLYQTMLDLSNNSELLSRSVSKNESERRRSDGKESSTVSSVSIPVAFIGQYDESIEKAKNGDDQNSFDVFPPQCSKDGESAKDDGGEVDSGNEDDVDNGNDDAGNDNNENDDDDDGSNDDSDSAE